MRNRAPLLLASALLAMPFMLGNKGCDDSSASDMKGQDTNVGGGSANVQQGSDGSDGTANDKLDPNACTSCPGPGPKAPTVECADGSVGGPLCARDAAGDCNWTIRACPENGGDTGGDPNEGSGATCGGFAGLGCADGEYCKFDASCGAADQTGVCATKPEACTADYSPVCGCDGKTYGNACGAAGAGVSVASQGECGASEPQPCNSCTGPQPGAPNYLCPDGVHTGGPACVFGADGQCGWHFLACPSDSGSSDCHSGVAPKDGCWSDQDCGGGKCIGASCCPVGAQCFVADTPGHCE